MVSVRGCNVSGLDGECEGLHGECEGLQVPSRQISQITSTSCRWRDYTRTCAPR